ncbi:carbohydrate ABC transporter permease [Ammoniphilus sp. YIM 78166]|uniref:carbohydrate ABC transporter permease n=1 Tax=Ammoniphilus sp. YIM 78166 TaxID=1644106 RepID=UPI0035163637
MESSIEMNSKTPMAVKTRRPIGSWLATGFVSLVLLTFFLVIAYPLFWMVINSLKTTEAMFTNSWALPTEWMFSNYVQAWNQGVSKYFLNSVIVTSVTVVFTLLFSAFAAYGLSRFDFRGKFVVLALLSGGIMFSPQVSLIPLYKLVQILGIHDTLWALILPYLGFRMPLIILLIRSFFLSVPKEFEEAAYLEGCSSFGIFCRIYLPLSLPILFTSGILTAYWAWNEFLFAIIFVDSDANKTITSGLLAFRDAMYTDWSVLMSGLVISALPLIIVFILMQKSFIRGLAEGGVKG